MTTSRDYHLHSFNCPYNIYSTPIPLTIRSTTSTNHATVQVPRGSEKPQNLPPRNPHLIPSPPPFPFFATKGKLSYIHLPGISPEIIVDSHFILQHLIQTSVVPDLDSHLIQSESGDFNGVASMVGRTRIFGNISYSLWEGSANCSVMVSKSPFSMAIIIPYGEGRVFKFRGRNWLYHQAP